MPSQAAFIKTTMLGYSALMMMGNVTAAFARIVSISNMSTTFFSRNKLIIRNFLYLVMRSRYVLLTSTNHDCSSKINHVFLCVKSVVTMFFGTFITIGMVSPYLIYYITFGFNHGSF